MSANDDLRLAWQAHREGRNGRRDALLTLAVADASPRGEPWVHAVRDQLVASQPGHIFSCSHHLDEALGDRRVIAALKKLRYAFSPARVRNLLQRDAVARGPYTKRSSSTRVLLDDLLAPSRSRPRGPLKLGATASKRGIAGVKLGSAGVAKKVTIRVPVTSAQSESTPSSPMPQPGEGAGNEPTPENANTPPADSVLAFYMNVLVAVAMLCALVVQEAQGEKRAA